MVHSSDNRYNIAITGLNYAGKTSFVERLIKDTFNEDRPSTLGMDVAFFKQQDQPIQLFDLGGQSVFRRLIWQNYVRLSQGIIFIFDASDPNSIEDGSEWFWQVIDWTEESIPILFLANKWDLEDKMDLSHIIDALELKKLMKPSSHRSFRVFKTSCKTDFNIDESFSWLIDKVSSLGTVAELLITNIYISTTDGLPIASTNFIGQEENTTLVSSFFAVIDILASQIMDNDSEKLESLETDSYKIIMVKRNNILCTIRTNPDASPKLIRNFAENLIELAEQHLPKRGDHKDQNRKLRNYITKNFPDYIARK